MKNKKDLNIWLLVLSLITIITILLPFAKTLEIPEDLSLWIKIVFFGTIAVFIACLTLVSIISLACLIKDTYRPIKFIEFFVLLGFLMVFINIITFACSDFKLTAGYAVMALEAFIISAFSQSGRLFAAFPSFGKDFLSIFRKNPDATSEGAENDLEKQSKEDKKEDKKKDKKAKKEEDKNIKASENNDQSLTDLDQKKDDKKDEKTFFYDETLEEKVTPSLTEEISDIPQNNNPSVVSYKKSSKKGKNKK